MDTTTNLKKKRKESERGSGKQCHDNITENIERNGTDDFTVIIEGEKYEMAEDLKDLPEIDYNDPDVKKWLEEEEKEFKKKHPNLTHEEAMKIAVKMNIKVREDAVDHVWAVAEATAVNRSSMGQDVDNRRQTEIGTINGFIVREAKRLGLKAPVNETLTALVETLQYHFV